MDAATFKRGLIVSAIIGAVIGLAMCIAFGVLDVQCRKSPDGRYWNAELQRCQAYEVS